MSLELKQNSDSDTDTVTDSTIQLELKKTLKHALKRDELYVHYQPQIDLKSGKIIGAEALVRWNHPHRGLISPAIFIPIAEKSGFIIEIGEWVLRTACIQNKKWQDAGHSAIIVSVNLSAVQFSQTNLVETVRKALNESRLAPQYLELEITESMTMEVHRAIETLYELKKLGVKISIDDFGTGYSSLNYLKRFPIDKLKVDQSFVRECTIDPSDATIVKTIIGMAHNLKLQVVAEGVETKEHLIFLQKNLCDVAQGYFISKPVAADTLVEELDQLQELLAASGIAPEDTKQIWMEEALRQAKQELRETLRQQQGMTLKFKKIGNRYIHTLCDGELLYRMGLVPEQVVGKEIFDFLSKKDAKYKLQFYEKAWHEGINVNYEAEINGINYYAALRPILHHGQVVEVIGSYVDITERKMMEQTLQQSEAKYRLITENMSDVICLLDSKGFLNYASPSFRTILGYLPKEIEEQHFSQLFDEKDVKPVEKAFTEILASKSPLQFTFKCKHRDGTKISLKAKGIPVIEKKGKVKQIIVTLTKK